MAIYIHCPQCNERLEAMHHNCAHCGIALPPGVLYALSSALGVTPLLSPSFSVSGLPTHISPTLSSSTLYTTEERQTPPVQHSALRPWLAATLSLVCGLGQLYNGQLVKGMVLLICGIVAVVAWQFLLGKMVASFLWLYAISDAYLVARRTIPLRPRRQPGEH